jgi:hypothetical protein
MLALLIALMAAAPGAAPAPQGTTVSPAIVEARPKAKVLPIWADRIEPEGWPFAGAGDGGAVLMFAKSSKDDVHARYQRVAVRHEYAREQADVAGAYRSETIAQEVDCQTGAFRNLTLVRYPKNNLSGPAKSFPINETVWTTPEPGSFAQTVVQDACTVPDTILAQAPPP